ncbi:ABC transporter ATP-binding protein [Crassaminicella profunda]|uniref:ABC transporter ATP-binding protein n=1 Tax=Crassaminicella profunda TaxID=1286698 RepID=UPI001CA6DDB9|nr:dipeptide/oligopeptide/nickel ABC transporter ATP-binding protein [Crassaminicella profunda]QZY53863.1 dipeptide/oligopeptide/nickel ABC transporter ATP-binding protein [Crassaminicella profunda]
MIMITNLSKKYKENIALNQISFHIKSKESIAIVGESGSGKSTIGNILLGFESLTGGNILYEGRPIRIFNKKDWKNYRKNIQVVFQDAQNSLNPRMKVKDIIAEPLKNFTNFNRKQRYLKVKEILLLVDLNENDGEKYPYDFSTGQQKRINVARAIICRPQLVVIDEGTSGLDPEIKNNMIKLIRKLQKNQGITFVIITHDISVAQKLASHMIILKEGKIIENIENFKSVSQCKSNYAHELIRAVPKFKYKVLGGIK